jgi:hypothetical protein
MSNSRTRICSAPVEGKCTGYNSDGICRHCLPHKTISAAGADGGKCSLHCHRTNVSTPACMVIPDGMVKSYVFRLALNGIDISGWQDG